MCSLSGLLFVHANRQGIDCQDNAHLEDFAHVALRYFHPIAAGIGKRLESTTMCTAAAPGSPTRRLSGSDSDSESEHCSENNPTVKCLVYKRPSVREVRGV